MKKNYIKYVTAFAVVIGALGYFVITGMSGEKLYYKEVSELINDPSFADQRGLRVSGTVCDDNYDVDRFSRHAQFEVTDDAGGVMKVVYSGILPDAFEQGASVVLEGNYNVHENTFTANKLMAKCPSKYEADESEHPDYIKKS